MEIAFFPVSFYFFILGLFIGSFLNCLIFRIEKGESFLKGRSYCPKCKQVLGFKDLIPIFSFILLKGKCRYCKEKISIQYPLVEFFTGIFALVSFSPLISNFSFLNLLFSSFHFLFFCLLILIFVFDLKYFSIPNSILIFSILLSSLYRAINFLGFENLFLSLLPSLFFLFLVLISKERWLGFGDFEVSVFMALFLGFPKILAAILFSVFSGAIFGLFLILLKKKTLSSKIPFAPFLVSGTIFSFFFPQNLLE